MKRFFFFFQIYTIYRFAQQYSISTISFGEVTVKIHGSSLPTETLSSMRIPIPWYSSGKQLS